MSARRLRALPRSFFARPTVTVARALLGKLILRRRGGRVVQRARIVEVEAYLDARDRASHARHGPTPRAATMYGPPGRAYVYLVYGMHHCLNVVAERDGVAGAILIRAAALVGSGDPGALRGPGKVCRVLGITRAHDGIDLCRATGPLAIADDRAPPPAIARSPRIGVDYAGGWARRLLRLFVPGHPAVSGPRRPRGGRRAGGQPSSSKSRARSTSVTRRAQRSSVARAASRFSAARR